MKIINMVLHKRIRLEMKDGELIEIQPEGGELMAMIEVKYINEATEEEPHGALDIIIYPYHMDGGSDEPTTVHIRG